jgi:hypothetical protein
MSIGFIVFLFVRRDALSFSAGKGTCENHLKPTIPKSAAIGNTHNVHVLIKRYWVIIAFVVNLAFLSWFVNRYAHRYLVAALAVNVACAWVQNAGAGLAFGNLAWIAKGKFSNLGRLATFEAKKNPVYIAGFALNRLGSIIPPLYTLAVTWGRLPKFLVAYLIVDACVAVWAALYFEKWVRETGAIIASRRKQ